MSYYLLKHKKHNWFDLMKYEGGKVCYSSDTWCDSISEALLYCDELFFEDFSINYETIEDYLEDCEIQVLLKFDNIKDVVELHPELLL